MSCYDFDAPSVYSDTERTARKVHRCCECRRDRIRPGDRYHVHTGIWDGEWCTYRVCMRCARVGKALQVEDDAQRRAERAKFPDQPWRWDWPCLCWCFGDLKTALSERNNARRQWAAKEASK